MELVTLNQVSEPDFVSVVGPVFEHSPWIAARAAGKRPFGSVGELYEQLEAIVGQSTLDEQIGLICAHPDLAGRLAIAGELTKQSRLEQKSARLDQLTAEEFTRITALNDCYRARFGFPFVICVRDHSQSEIFDEFERRLRHDRSAEIQAALAQIGRIAWHRLEALMSLDR